MSSSERNLETKISLLFCIIGVILLLIGTIIASLMISSYQQGNEVSDFGLVIALIVIIIGLIIASLYSVFGEIVAEYIQKGKIDWSKNL